MKIFLFGKGYEIQHHQNYPNFQKYLSIKMQGKGKPNGKIPGKEKANVEGDQPASKEATTSGAADGTTWNGSPYGNQTESQAEA